MTTCMHIQRTVVGLTGNAYVAAAYTQGNTDGINDNIVLTETAEVNEKEAIANERMNGELNLTPYWIRNSLD